MTIEDVLKQSEMLQNMRNHGSHRLTIYKMAAKVAEQFKLGIVHNHLVQRGELRIIPDGISAGVYVNPLDVDFG